MLSRRHICGAGALLATSATFTKAFAADHCMSPTRERQAALTPEAALEKLKAGNARFVSKDMRNCDLLSQVRATSSGQFPSALIVGCIDSRVPPELVFDQRIGDVFSARVAGNVVDDNVIGGSEFAAKLMGAKLIVVLGHSECGAIKGAIDGAELGMLTQLLHQIEPAIEASSGAAEPHTSKNASFVQEVALANARLGAQRLAEKSEVLRDMVARKDVMIVSAMHDVASGRITFLD